MPLSRDTLHPNGRKPEKSARGESPHLNARLKRSNEGLELHPWYSGGG